MLEKIGLPAKPSLRGNNWVVDASHCQSCGSPFTFINRKHHCRRCGGLFCNNCTLHRMVLRGQGDSPVRICDPCKQLEEAARFQLRSRGSAKLGSKHEDQILSQILGTDPSSRQGSNDGDVFSFNERARSSSSHSTSREVSHLDEVGVVLKTVSVENEMTSTSPEELRRWAVDEKKRYKDLKGEGKSDEALKAFKRGKELERRADALEVSLRKNRRKVSPTGSTADVRSRDSLRESGRRSKPAGPVDKDDFMAELKELGWSDIGSRGDDKKPSNMSLEGELSSLIGEPSQSTQSAVKDEKRGGIDKSQVVVLKKKALALKREGKLAEAKEELKKAKILEKQLEEEEFLGADEDSDDEISALIRSIGDDEQDELLAFKQDHGFDFDHLVGTFDNIGVDADIEVTGDDLVDPEMAATLKSLGWADDDSIPEKNVAPTPSVDRGRLSSEILSLKQEALNQKRAGNAAQAMALLKKAKLLERDLESDSGNLVATSAHTIPGGLTNQATNWMDDMDVKPKPKSRLAIQKELLALKKKALALRREGRADEAEEELKKGKDLEQQLEEMDNGSKVKAAQVTIGTDRRDISFEHRATHANPSFEDGDDDVTDQDMHDPAYLSMLRNLGWNDDGSDLSSYPQNPSKERVNSAAQIVEPVVNPVVSSLPARKSKRSKAEIQRELLGLKRKALALRREGKTDDAEEVLKAAKGLEAEIAELEEPKKEVQVDSTNLMVGIDRSPDRGDVEDVTNEDMHDPAMIAMLKNLGWQNEDVDHAHSISALKQKSKLEIQRELLGLKRKALSHRRAGEIEEAEELLKKAKVLESQIQETESLEVGLLPTTSKDATSDDIKLLTNKKTQASVKSSEKSSEKSAAAAIDQGELANELFIGAGRKEHNVTTPFTGISERIVPETSHNNGDKSQLFGESWFMASAVADEGTSSVPPTQSANIMDLLTGDGWSGSHITAGNHDDTITFKSTETLAQNGSLLNPFSDVDGKQESGKMREDNKNADTKQLPVHQMNSAKLLSDNNENSIQQEVLARKRKAVGLKREGKLAEALEELRQAKLLERTIGEGIHEPETGTLNVSASTVSAPTVQVKKPSPSKSAVKLETGTVNVSASTLSAPEVQVKEPSPSKSAAKPLSGRDRFKLQQESLSHKRQALKLRREGRTEEADAELELAKALEAQMEDLGPAKADSVDDVIVEDFLDPQLLSALQAIGIDGANEVPRVQERPKSLQEPVPLKVSPGKPNTSSQERSQLEERIKAEKVKALRLKRSGQQVEALDALRQAKLLEKKLNALN